MRREGEEGREVLTTAFEVRGRVDTLPGVVRAGNEARVGAARAGRVVLGQTLLHGLLGALAGGHARRGNGGVVVDVLDITLAGGRGTGGEEAGALAGKVWAAGTGSEDEVLERGASVEAQVGVGCLEGRGRAGTRDAADGAAGEVEGVGDGTEVVDSVRAGAADAVAVRSCRGSALESGA